MSKNKIWLHLTIFLILLMGTAYFAYEAFAPSELTINTKQKTTNNFFTSESEIAQQKKINENNETKEKNDLKDIDTKTNLKIEQAPENISTTSTKEKTDSTIQEEIIETLPYSATIIINGQNYEVGFSEEEIILKDLMDKLQNESNFKYSGKEYSGIGTFVEEINGIKNSNKDNKYWIYYKNGQSANIGISNQKINSGDKIEWKYEEITF